MITPEEIDELINGKKKARRKETAFGFSVDFMRQLYTEPNSGCWFWLGAPEGSYGRTRNPATGQSMYAHRYAYEKFVGPIPEGLEIDHTCNVRCCVNPDHMEVVTRQENMRRARDRFRQKGTCRKGHAMTPENLYIDPKGNYVCRACRNESARRFRERKNNERFNQVP